MWWIIIRHLAPASMHQRSSSCTFPIISVMDCRGAAWCHESRVAPSGLLDASGARGKKSAPCVSSQASGRNVVRLQCQQAPSTGAWLTAFPAASLVNNAMYRTMAKFWLGAPLLSNCSSTAIYPFCSESSDFFFGDHFLCCKRYDFHARHDAVVAATTRFLRAGGFTIRNEVQMGDRERPADIFISNWTSTEPAALDVTVTHPLHPV